MDDAKRDWSSLPEHLLSLIAKCLHTRIDILRFRGVCNSFRSCRVPSPVPPFPDLHFYYYPIANSLSSIHFVVAESTVYAIEPVSEISNAHQVHTTWLLNVEDSPSGKVRVLDSFSALRFEHISEMLPESLNLLDYRVKEISKGYRLKLAIDQPSLEHNFFQKVVVSTDDYDDDEFAVMVLIESQVVVWRREDNKWVDIDRYRFPFISDIISHNKKFYVLDSDGSAITVDAKSFSITEPVARARLTTPFRPSQHLVKSSTDLFLIKKYFLDLQLCGFKYLYPVKSDGRCCQVSLSIYKLNEEKNEWIEVKDGFKDIALFMSKEFNFFLSAEEFSGCKRNCVHLVDRPLTNVNYGYLENHITEMLSAFPGDSEIFWPPPAWLFP